MVKSKLPRAKIFLLVKVVACYIVANMVYFNNGSICLNKIFVNITIIKQIYQKMRSLSRANFKLQRSKTSDRLKKLSHNLTAKTLPIDRHLERINLGEIALFQLWENLA